MRFEPDAALLAFAEQVGTEGPVAAEGARTRWDSGGQLHPDTRLVHAPAGILEHRPEEMTVRVRAGTPVAELHAALAAAGQRTGLPERSGTVGGALAVGENGLEVLGRGRVRDTVLQLTYVSADAKVVTGGGPTVKNVSGFDLPRLLVGSLGTLGLVGEVILRTNPIPAASAWLAAEGADPFALLDALHRPSAVLWDGSRTWVHLEGYDADVAAERDILARLGAGTWELVDGPPPLPPHRWSLRPSDLRSLPDTQAGAFVASVGVGTAWVSTPQPARPVPPGLARLSARVKAQFDPSGRLNPGRSPLPTGAS